MSTPTPVPSTPLQPCAMRIGEIELQRTTAENCKVSWTIYVDNETIRGWTRQNHSPGFVFKRDVDRRIIVKPDTKINIVFHKHRKGPLPKADDFVAIDGQDILRKLHQANISPGTAAQVVHEVSTGRLTAKMSFATTSNAYLGDAAIQAFATASSAIRRTSLQESMVTVGRTLNLLGKVGVRISEINPHVKAAVNAFNVVVDKAHKDDQDAAVLQELVGDMENMLSFVHSKNFEDSVRFAKLTVSEMLVSTESAFRFAADCFLSNAALRAVQSAVTPRLDSTKIDNFRKEFLKLKKQLERDLQLQIASDVHKQDIRECLAELLPVLPIGLVNGYNASQSCMEGTRKSILQEICAWSSLPQSSGLFWLSGVAGSGKTSIASSLVGKLRGQGRLCMSFFCQYQDANLSSPQAVIPSLAQQLRMTFPPFQQPLFEVLSDNRAVIATSIWTMSIKDQFEYLMKRPLLAMSGHHHTQPLIIIVDALDECEEKHRVQLVVYLRKMSALLPWLKVFLTSRPEPDICCSLFGVTPLDLQQTSDETTEDIRQFTEVKLSEITSQKYLEAGWANETDIERFVMLAGDLFIWARAALDFIGKATSPRLAMEDVLALQASGSSHEQQMDELYKRVLEEHFKDGKSSVDFRQVMGFVLMSAIPLPLTTLIQLVGHSVKESTLKTVLSYLGALLSTDVIRPFHASFAQYLTSQRCPVEFFIDPKKSAFVLLEACLHVMNSKKLHFNMYNINSSYHSNLEISSATQDLVSDELKYGCRYWVVHLNQLSNDIELEKDIRRLLCNFLSKKLLFWLEVVAVLHALPSIIHSLELACSIKQVEIFHPCHELWRFLRQFSIPISFRISHIYISALPFAPGETALYKDFKHEFPGTLVICGLEKQWLSACLNVLEGHSGLVCSVAFSPDGARIVSGSNDNTIRIWDAESGEALGAPLEGHSRSVNSVAFSPDGARIVSGSDDNTIRIWDAQSGEAVGAPLEGHSRSVNSVAFSPDGARIVSGSNDNTIRIWDAQSGEAVGAPLRGHLGSVDIVTSPNGARIVSGSHDNTIRIWDAQSGEAVGAPLRGHSGSVDIVVFSPEGARIDSGSDDNTIHMWDAQNDEAVGAPLEGHSGMVESLTFFPDGTRIISGSYDNTIRIWDAQSVVLRKGNHYFTRDGWVLDREGSKLLWVPLHYRSRFNDCSLFSIPRSGPNSTLIVDMSKFVHGTEWTKCYAGTLD